MPVDLDPPRADEILVEVRAAGVCHSDLHPARGDWPMQTPVVLGHEGAGVVSQVGASVTGVTPGDHVIFCWAPPCGECPTCAEGRWVLCDRLEKVTYRNRLPSGGSRLHADGRDVASFLGTGCFATHAVVHASGVIPVPSDVPLLTFDALATLGCAVITGVGAVLNAARVPAGSKVVVIGAGGVGLNVVQGAVIADCAQIIAIDTRPGPLTLARSFGATDISRVGPQPVPDAVRDLTAGRGADFVFDTVGSPETLSTALDCAKKGGTVVLTGLSRRDSQASIPMFPFVMREKRLIGSVYGSGKPTDDIARILSLFLSGRIKLHELAVRTYSLDRIEEAMSALAAAVGGRGVIRFETPA